MKKNDKIFNKAVEKLQKAGSRASLALSDVSSACDGLRNVTMNLDEMHSTTCANLDTISKEQIEAAVEKALDEWIWVEGYKGTDKDMKCNGYQYMMGVRHDMPEGAEIKECESGFHFCRDLKDVYNYYDINKGHRFFKVRALVRKKDYEAYGKPDDRSLYGYVYLVPSFTGLRRKNKLTSKSIEFLSELTADEILTACGTDISGWTDEDKSLAMEKGTLEVYKMRKVRDLITIGFSDLMAHHIVYALDKYEMAKVLMSQQDISMDTRISILFDSNANSDTTLWWDKAGYETVVRPITGSFTGTIGLSQA